MDEAAHARQDRQRLLDDTSKRFVLIMTEGALRWQAGSPQVMVELVKAIIEAGERANVDIGIVPWTTPNVMFPGHGFAIYDDDAVVVDTETATAFITGAADIATYAELFAALEAAASFGDEATAHLERIAGDYRRLAAESE